MNEWGEKCKFVSFLFKFTENKKKGPSHPVCCFSPNLISFSMLKIEAVHALILPYSRLAFHFLLGVCNFEGISLQKM